MHEGEREVCMRENGREECEGEWEAGKSVHEGSGREQCEGEAGKSVYMRGVGGNSVSGREGRVYMRGVGGNSVRGREGRVYMRGVGGNSVRGKGREQCEWEGTV